MATLTVKLKDTNKSNNLTEPQNKQPSRYAKYFGTIHFSKDGLTQQQQLRKEWNKDTI